MTFGGLTFGARLLHHRKHAGLSQEELSERSGVSVRAISDMERGRARSPQRRTTEALLDALGLDDRGREELRGLARTGRIAPRNPVWSLPLYVADLVGRDAELDTIATTHDRLVVVHGAAGTGKTSLAVKAAHLLESRFPDGQLLIELDGDAPLERLLKDLGVPAAHMPEDANGQRRLYLSLLTGKRLLLVLDGASTEEELRTLAADEPGCLTIVTSRRRLGAPTRIRLGGLTEDAAVELLASIIGQQRVDADLPAAHELVRLCGMSPLALRIAGNRLASRPRWPLRHLVEQIEERRLAALTAGDLDVRGAFEVSLAHLPETARLVFRRLGLLAGTRVTAEVAAGLAGIGVAEAERALEDLADVGLLDADDHGYSIHGLVRTFANSLV